MKRPSSGGSMADDRWGVSRRVLLGAGAAMPLLRAGAGRAAPATLVLKRGLNTWPWFALTREFPAPRIDYDWPPFQDGRPVPRPADLRRLREAGFDFIRLPVDPGPFLAFDGDRRARLMAMLDAAIHAALAAGLSVVVNLSANEATHHFNSAWMSASLQAPGFPAYLALVRDIARLLARAPQDRVGFEPVNEPDGACASGAWPPVQKALLGAARSVAADLTLVATGSCGSMVGGLEALDPDGIGVAGPLLFTFHFYEPYLFSHQGAPWVREPVYRSLNAVPWPASSGSLEKTLAAVRARMALDTDTAPDAKAAAYAETVRVLRVYFDAQPARPFVDGYFARIRAWAARHGIEPRRVMVGEFGALRSDSRYVAAGAPDRARYVRDVREAAEAAGFPWAFWNMFDGMGVMDDATHAFDPAIVAALGLRMPPG